MRESLMYGSVRGTRGNSRPYRDEGARQSWRDQVPDHSAFSRAQVPRNGPAHSTVTPLALIGPVHFSISLRTN
jgi:hypothetical protein